MDTASITTVASRIKASFSSVIKHNLFFILIISFIPRIPAYIFFPEKIGNWSATFLDENSPMEAQSLQAILIILQYILVATIYYNALRGGKSFFKALGACLKKTHKIAITSLLYLFAVVLGMVLLILPGIYVMIIYSLAFISVIAKDISIIEAFKHSKYLITDNWIFSFFTIVTAISAPSLLFGLIGYHASSYTHSVLINESFIILANMVSLVAMVAVILFLYEELTARKASKQQ